MKFLIIAALACVATALPAAEKSYGRKEVSYSKSYTYQGKYSDKCGADGLYYRDIASFVFCSNGNSYVQPCAPGSRNAAYDSFSYGKSYGYNDFCGVNLNDFGYGSYGYGKPGYRPGPVGKVDNYEKKEVSYERKDAGYAGKGDGYARKEVSYERRDRDGYAGYNDGADYERKQVTYERRDRDGGYGGYAVAPRGGYERKQVSYERRDRDGYGYGYPGYGGYGGYNGYAAYPAGYGYAGYGFGPVRGFY